MQESAYPNKLVANSEQFNNSIIAVMVRGRTEKKYLKNGGKIFHIWWKPKNLNKPQLQEIKRPPNILLLSCFKRGIKRKLQKQPEKENKLRNEEQELILQQTCQKQRNLENTEVTPLKSQTGERRTQAKKPIDLKFHF